MGTFCFDQYDHPLLWCEEKKRLVERRNADESIREWNQKKAEEHAKKEQDKREYYELSATHCPWGRPGGGAPNLDIRKRNITAEGLHPTPGYIPRGSSLPPCHINLGNTGHIRSAADRLYITLKDHPSLSFRKKGPVDIELHYKSDKLHRKPKMQLDKITVLEKQPKFVEKKRSAEVDHCPWGKPGPGGAPWRNPKSVGSSFMRSLGWTNKELLKELDQDNPQTAPSEKAVKSKEKSPKESVGKCCPKCTCKCSATGTTLTTSESEATNNVGKPCKGPNGKVPGSVKTKSGSPEKSASDQKGKSVRVKRPSRATAAAAGASGCHRKPNILCPVAAAASEGVELVPLLARRRGIHRPVSLSSTDVTKRVDCNRSTTTYNIEYLKELKRQIAQHVHRMKLAQEQEVDLCNRHFRTFEEFWGRPGHGAPRDIKIKMNLDDLLYGVSE